MRTRNFSPNNANLASVDFSLGAIHVSNAFAQVKVGVLARLDAFDFEKRCVFVLAAFATLETKEATFCVQSTQKLSE